MAGVARQSQSHDLQMIEQRRQRRHLLQDELQPLPKAKSRILLPSPPLARHTTCPVWSLMCGFCTAVVLGSSLINVASCQFADIMLLQELLALYTKVTYVGDTFRHNI